MKSVTRRVRLDEPESSRYALNILSVLHQCALTKDLTLFEAGDATEVGEKGLTLRYIVMPFTLGIEIDDSPTFVQRWSKSAQYLTSGGKLISHYFVGASHPSEGRVLFGGNRASR